MENAQNFTKIRASEIPLLSSTVLLFLTLSLYLQIMNEKELDGALAGLQRMRPFLERFSEMAVSLKAKRPVEVLDFIAKKEFRTLGQRMNGILLSTETAHFLQDALCKCLTMSNPLLQDQLPPSNKLN